MKKIYHAIGNQKKKKKLQWLDYYQTKWILKQRLLLEGIKGHFYNDNNVHPSGRRNYYEHIHT